MRELLKNALVIAAWTGFWASFSVDLFEWMKKPDWRDTSFNWALASKRWFVGTLTAVLAASGLGVVALTMWWVLR